MSTKKQLQNEKETDAVSADALADLISRQISKEYFNIYCVDMDADRVIYTAVSEVARRNYGERILSGAEKYSKVAAIFCRDLVSAEDQTRVAAACELDNIREKLVGGASFSLMCRALVDGEQRYVELRFIPLSVAPGKRHFIWAFTDAEERMRAEMQKYEQNAVISGLAQDFDCVSYVDLKKNTITDHRVSPVFDKSIDGWSDTVNFAAKMMLLANSLVIPSERESFLKKVDAKTIRSMLETRPVYYVSCRVSMYGKERAYQLKMVSDADSKDHLILGIHSISEAMNDRRKMLVQNAVLDGLTSDFECVCYVEFTENRVTSYRISENFAKHIPGWRSVTDYAVRMRLLADALVVEDDRERFIFMTTPEQVMRSLAEDPVHYVVFRIAIRDEVKIYQAKYILDPNNRNCVILGIHNVDREKKQEMERHAQEDAARIRSDFLTQMSHDILAPLAGMQTALMNARSNIADAELLQSSLETADVTAEYLYRLVSDVLKLTRESDGADRNAREPMNMRLFAERCAAVIEEQATERKLRLVRYFDDIAHPHVLFDAPHLRQILLNLLNNAVKYTPEGGTVTFRVSELGANEQSVTFKIDIADTGRGMSRDILEHIWDVFALRADAGDPGSSGTGLGLAVCKMLADSIGATITVDSKVGEGSCFTVLLPAEIDRTASQQRASEDVSILNGMHILLADDNQLSRGFMKEALQDAGAIATEADNGKAALELFSSAQIGEYDLVLLDNLMPEMGGIEAAAAIRALPRDDARTVPIIGYSAGISEEDLAAFRAAGINAYLEKPIQVPVLVNTLLQCIHSRSQMLEKELAVAHESVTKDALTGVRNRTAYERMEAQLDRDIADGKCTPFALLFCDVNGLKATNDTFGHARGDELIRSACRLICDTFRHSMVFRLGGDEFAALICGADFEQRETLRPALDAPSEAYGGVSVACGLAVFDPERDKRLRDVYKRADAEMYDDKRAKKAKRAT